MRRRRFLGTAVGWAGASPLISFSLAAAAEVKGQPKTNPDLLIYQGDYPGWPWITKTRSGTLHCVWREGTRHDFCPQGRLMLSSSQDAARTWSAARVILDEPGVDDRNVAIVELPNRDLLATYNTYTESRVSLAMSIRSTDGGQTWSKPASIGEPNTRTKAAAVVLGNGTLVLPFYIAPGSGALAAVSTDNGHQWRTVRVPDTEGFVGDEWDLIEVQPGRLVGIVRNSHPQSDGTFWVTESRDDGVSWSVPRRSNARSQRHTSPPQLTIHQGRPLLVYSNRRMVSVCLARTSDPHFLKWDVEHQVECFRYNADESPIADGSYPVSVELDGNRRFVVDYEIREKSHAIAGYFVDLPAGW